MARATLTALAVAGCGESSPPPVDPPAPPAPVGTISGSVTVEGAAVGGVVATLSSGASARTNEGGDFVFSSVEAGTYAVAISGYPEDATFARATQSATISAEVREVRLSFEGEYVRSSSVAGAVVATDAATDVVVGLAGVTAKLGGELAAGETAETAEDGGFAFVGLRAGTYAVEISGFAEDVVFDSARVEVEVGVDEVGEANFAGGYVRTSAVEGRVSADGERLRGVTVELSGGPAEESFETRTGADGGYRFGDLRAGDYEVAVSGFDAEVYEFASTSRDVSVGVGETETVSFEGALRRASGIVGRVSVDGGRGLGDVEVALESKETERVDVTDANGQYAFAGLPAGDYTVSIEVEGGAYVFDRTSRNVTVAEGEATTVNFEGRTATTASVSGAAFIDEAPKNDAFDEDRERAFDQAGIPVELEGPEVGEKRTVETDERGRFSFADLEAGSYRLRVQADEAEIAAKLASRDVAYGGPASGYVVELGVGEAATRAIPFDVTHTTVDFAVTLKSGEARGDALPGAEVTLYADTVGGTAVGSGTTGEDGAVAIRVARAGTTDRTVYATVAAEGYRVDGEAGRQAVEWDPRLWRVGARNEVDVVNPKVDLSVAGKTVETGLGGGAALGGWAIGVTVGGEAVEGAPKELDEEGMAKLEATAMSVPATYAFMLAKDQEDELDGGEKYESEAVEYTHTGLKRPGATQSAGVLEMRYATQTLVVHVHHERDHVEGYMGRDTVGDLDYVDVEVRYADGGVARSFTSEEWDPKHVSEKDGAITFRHVPAGPDVLVRAGESVAGEAAGIVLLGSDDLAAYGDMEANGIVGGAFGEEGGFHHTVSLCPLQAEPCASFAYVTTHAVSGRVWSRSVAVEAEGEGFELSDFVKKPGIVFELDPVEAENLAGEEKSFETLEEDDASTEPDETWEFAFAGVPSGVYRARVPRGWRIRVGEMDSEVELADRFDPLEGDVVLDVTPATSTVFGRVTNPADGFPRVGASVTASGKKATTDAHGRYVLEGVGGGTRISVTARSSDGARASERVDFRANALERVDILLGEARKRATVSGTVRASTGEPISGVRIRREHDGSVRAVATTGDDGAYTTTVDVVEGVETMKVWATKDGMSFEPESRTVSAKADATTAAADFTGFEYGTITGRVADANGRALAGVLVRARRDGKTADRYTTGETGFFTLSVPYGSYGMTFTKGSSRFEIPAAYRTSVTVAPARTVDVGTVRQVG